MEEENGLKNGLENDKAFERPDEQNKEKAHGVLEKGVKNKAIIKLNEEENDSSTPLW